MLTLEERERIAYITNSPDHALIVQALDTENEEIAELSEKLEEALDDAKHSEKEVGRLTSELETAADDLETSEARVEELEQAIHDSGVDLVV